jgi:hypothetical protein
MGIIRPSKMPKAKYIRRKDDPGTVAVYAKGGKLSQRARFAQFLAKSKKK